MPKSPDVVSVPTAVDATEDGIANMIWTGGPVRDDGGFTVNSLRPLLNGSEWHLGEPLAMVVATSKQAAADALEPIELNIEAADALALSVDDMLDGHLCGQGLGIILRLCTALVLAVDSALAASAHVSHFEFNISKITACAMEMRNSIDLSMKMGKLVLPQGKVHLLCKAKLPAK